MRKVIRIGLKGKSKVTPEGMALASNLKSRVKLIQALIPIGLAAVAEELKHEVEELAGIKHSRQGGLPGHYRWGIRRDRFISLTRSFECGFPECGM